MTRRALGESLLLFLLVLITFFAAFHLDRLSLALGLTRADRPAHPSPATAGTPPARVRLLADHLGHFEVTAQINGQAADFVIDTGASAVVLSFESAQRLGLAEGLRFTGTTITANGLSKVAPIRLPAIQIGEIIVEDVRAHVAPRGKLSINLLGMSFIRRLQRLEMRGRELILVK